MSGISKARAFFWKSAEASQDVEEIKGAISGAEVHGFDFEGLCTPVASSCGSLAGRLPSVLV